MSNKSLIKTGDTSFDKVWAHYKDPSKFPLTPNQEKIKERWLAAWTLLLKKKKKTKAATILEEALGVSRAQAFRDIRNAERLFGNVMKADRDGQMALLYEFALEGFKKSLSANDFKAAKGFHSAMMECVGEEKDLNFNPEKLENKPVKMSVNKEVANALLSHLLTGTIDLNNLTIDADFEEVEDNG